MPDPEQQVVILHEDETLIFVDKPPGIVVQRGYDSEEPILYDLVARHTSPLFLMQRLDRGTSGVMFFSKSAAANPRLTRMFERKQIRKTYIALCEGELTAAQTIDAPLDRIGPISFGVREGGKRAVTHVRPLVPTPRGTIVVVRLETGRTHQIRVHMASIGHPLVGDWLYGERNAVRPMLHAAELAMPHPTTGESLTVAAPLPADLIEEAARRGISVPARGQGDTWSEQLSD